MLRPAPPAIDARRPRLGQAAGEAMGSPLRLLAAADLVDRAWRVVAEEFAAAEADLTRFDAGSPLSALNRIAGGGSLQPVPWRLLAALRAAEAAYRTTAGAFDPRIIGALETAGERAGVPLPPSPDRLRPGERWLVAAAGRAALSAPVDLGGIGKGLALGWTASALRRAGCDAFLVEAGGDVTVGGRPPGGGRWRVAITHPRSRERLAVVALAAGALATSSTARRRWLADGTPRHHLIDARTGRPSRSGLAACTVWHADPAVADALATALMARSATWRDIPPDLPAWAVDEAGGLRMTPAGERLTTWRISRPG